MVNYYMNKNIIGKFPAFQSAVNEVLEGVCPFCHKPVNVNGFRDEISEREFKISGLCQKCQDSFFGTGEGGKKDPP
jgi:hypothetical protein